MNKFNQTRKPFITGIVVLVMLLGVLITRPSAADGAGNIIFLPVIQNAGESTAPGVVNKGDITAGKTPFVASSLAANQVHRWTVELFEFEVVSFTAIAPAPADIILTLAKDGQTIINRQNQSPAGVAEILTTPEIPADGVYEIFIQTAGGTAADYAIAPFSNGFPRIAFPGFLTPGMTQNAVKLPTDTIQYWFFPAEAGSRLSATITPDTTSDVVVELFGPRAVLLDIIDRGAVGQAETITNRTLAAGGLHALGIVELNFTGMDYDIRIDLSP